MGPCFSCFYSARQEWLTYCSCTHDTLSSLLSFFCFLDRTPPLQSENVSHSFTGKLQNSSFKKSFYMFALNDEEKKKDSLWWNYRSLWTRGTNVCGWICMNFVWEMGTCEAVGLIYKISHTEKLSSWGDQKTLRHCWARIIQITSSGKTSLNLVAVYLISIVLVIVAWYQFHRQLRQVRGDSTGSVTDRGERWDAEPSEVSYNTPKRLRCGEKKKTQT